MPWDNKNGGGWSGGGSGKNPWDSSGRGRRPNGGGRPPEIDDLIRKSQDRMKNMFSGRSSGMGLIVLVLLALIGWSLTGFYTIQPAQQGIVLRFGKFVETTNPGINYHLPSPIETVVKVDVTRQNQINVGFRGAGSASTRTGSGGRNVPEESIMLTGDENIVDIEFAVIWQIIDAEKFLFNLQNQEDVVKAVAESAMREVVGRTPVQDIITTQREAVTQQVSDEIQATLDGYESGILITQLVMQRADPPAEVIAAVRDVQSAQADRERLQNEGDAYRNRSVNEAQGQARRVRETAEAFKQERVTIATGEATRFTAILDEYQKNTEVVRTRMYLEAMEEVLSKMDKLILDQEAGTGAIPYLPLQDMLKRGSNQ
jgi:membrane protease subunit HflK